MIHDLEEDPFSPDLLFRAGAKNIIGKGKKRGRIVAKDETERFVPSPTHEVERKPIGCLKFVTLHMGKRERLVKRMRRNKLFRKKERKKGEHR